MAPFREVTSCLTPAGQPTTNQSVWPSNGIATIRAKFDTFFRRFRDAGGRVDWLIIDFEDGYSNWSIGGMSASNHWLAIQNDPRFPPLAQRLGFSNLLAVANWSGGREYLKWNAVMAGGRRPAPKDGQALGRGQFCRVLPRFALNGTPRSGRLQSRRKSKCLSETRRGQRMNRP